MQAVTRGGLKRLAGGAAIAVASVATVTMAMPATASAAAILPPVVKASSSGNSITMAVTNPNPVWTLSGCQAFVINAKDVPAVIDDPTKLLDPDVVVYPSVANPATLFAALPGQTVKTTTPDIPTGLYGVVGGCVALLDLMHPVIDEPQVMQVGLIPGGSSDGSSALSFGS
ncbi:hypothetical protein [Rhodococcus sp. NPDC058481]|uniref:hypothetical protein n=1 Tax=unclassified Rhodococcus (in: high G+C Gram-positive bacteria) TaxID=192944 RepID=UPI00366462A8